MVFASLGCFGHSARASQHLEPQPPKPMSRPMSRLSRRSFLTVSAALASRSAFAAGPAATPPVDVVIVGAGAAGVAAARRIAAAGRKFVVIEAADHIGGRCVTDTRSFGVPFDRGAHWIHTPDFNPLMKLIPRRGLEVYPAPASQRVRIGRRYAREGELEDFLALQVRANRGIIEAARKGDIACAQALPNDLGDWRPAIEFVLGPFSCAKDLSQVSTADYAKSAERNTDAFCRQGLGTMLATFAEGIAVKLSTPATAIDTRRGVVVETPSGAIAAHTAIVTVSTNVLASGAIKFTPELPKRQVDALGKLSLGSYDHIALELAGNPLGFESDELVLEKSTNTKTAAILGNVSGTQLCLIEVAGSFGRELSSNGEAAMVNFAADWLAELYGSDVKKAIKRSQATRWNTEARTLGAFSAAAPGGQGARKILMEPLQNAIWFAGEAAHETLWGTVGGAWESGERAADAVLHRLGGGKEAAETTGTPARTPQRTRVAPRYYRQ
jgi:monoamine oxidase